MSQDWLRVLRADVEAWLDQTGMPETLSASRYLLHRTVSGALEEHACGRVLEAGPGVSPFSQRLRQLAGEVVTLDIFDRYGDVDVIADVQDMHEIGSSSFDTVVCTQVLEHLPDPPAAMREMRRVVKDGGSTCVVCASPFDGARGAERLLPLHELRSQAPRRDEVMVAVAASEDRPV